jgi:hypothetical protein
MVFFENILCDRFSVPQISVGACERNRYAVVEVGKDLSHTAGTANRHCPHRPSAKIVICEINKIVANEHAS